MPLGVNDRRRSVPGSEDGSDVSGAGFSFFELADQNINSITHNPRSTNDVNYITSPQGRYFNRIARLQNAEDLPNLNPFEDHSNIPNSYHRNDNLINNRSRSISPLRDYSPSVLGRSPSPNKALLSGVDRPEALQNPFLNIDDDGYDGNNYNDDILHKMRYPQLNDSNIEMDSIPERKQRTMKFNQSDIYHNHSENPYHYSSNDGIFGGYEFDDDEEKPDDQDDQFVPFPTLNNTYYPVNIPRNIYNPFAVDYSDMDSYRSGEEDEPEELLRSNTYKNAKAVNDTVNEYTKNEGEIEGEYDEVAAKQVRMVNGNLVLDCPVSDILLNKYKTPLTENDREFLFMRFQACTVQPEDFQNKMFSLRQRFYTKPRDTELMIVVTMYNEDDFLLARTLKGVFKNIRYLYGLKNSSTWGKNSWQKVVVTIVSDGRQKINPRTKALLAALGVYQEGFAKNKINDDDVVAHIYEYTTMVGISKIHKDHITLTTDNQIPIQLVFCLKEQNQRKINSHKWALKAFAPVLNPNVIILLDVGTQPENKALYKLWRSFKDNPKVAGSCGEIKASLGKNMRLLLNPLVAAQNFEYKISNILDKPMESVFGFITVLPGAFSAYRYKALLGEPMEKYLKGEDLRKNNNDGIFNANMYLAEDRILCFELIAKLNENWILKYINNAGAYTDVPEQLDDFISQRRRWLNGSFFAAVYSIFNFYKIWSTNHSIMRKIALHFEFIYQFFNLLVSWFSLGSYYLVFRILSCYLAEPDSHFSPGNVLSVFFLWLYMASLTTTFVLSFGNKPKGTKVFYLVIVIFFAILMAYMIFATIWMSVKSVTEIVDDTMTFTWKSIFVEARFRNLIIAISSTYLLYLLGFLMFLQPQHMFTSFFQYMLLSPSYINVLNIYAFCNVHDISWGTKGQDKMNDLGVAKKRGSKDDELEIVIPTTKKQIDEGYSRMVQTLTVPPLIETGEDAMSVEEQTQVYYAFFRSMTVLMWMFSNFIIVAFVTNAGGLYQLMPGGENQDSILPEKQTFYFLTVILYLVAFFALFRFIGCVVYLIQRFLNKFGIRS